MVLREKPGNCLDGESDSLNVGYYDALPFYRKSAFHTINVLLFFPIFPIVGAVAMIFGCQIDLYFNVPFTKILLIGLYAAFLMAMLTGPSYYIRNNAPMKRGVIDKTITIFLLFIGLALLLIGVDECLSFVKKAQESLH